MGFLWLVPALPFAGFIVLALGHGRLSRTAANLVGPGAIGLAALAATYVSVDFMRTHGDESFYTQVLWTWLTVGDFSPRIALYLDALSIVMMLVVTWVGFLIHVYSTSYMEDDPDYNRFFAYMNLFVGSMLVLVLADNLMLLYLGWEGVGLCSYLLIGFWFKEPANGRAAIKAFLVTRIGDTFMALGLFLIVMKLGTLDIQHAMDLAKEAWPVGSGVAIATAALLLGGALGKSGQLPLQVWLPDAMAGPTPVSALIHAATMVTAGVYLIARTNVFFILAPQVHTAVAVIGALTLLIAGFSALSQRDIKRVLAYSTISQIGYMFLALGVGAWSAAIMHFMTHAFFKALLFMGAGAVIVSLHHEQDMFKMGGLRRKLPVVFWTFLIGSMSLSAIPLISSGFYSKDLILWDAMISEDGSVWLWLAGYVGAFITALYTFRMVFLTFFGEEKTHPHALHDGRLLAPLVILAIASTVAGFMELPRTLGDWHPFIHFEESALPAMHAPHPSLAFEIGLQLVTVLTVAVGIYLAYLLFLRKRAIVENWVKTPFGAAMHRFSFSGCGFDWLYQHIIIDPFIWLAWVNRSDFVDSIYTATAAACRGGHYVLSATQTGRLRWYMAGIAFGAVVTIVLVVFL